MGIVKETAYESSRIRSTDRWTFIDDGDVDMLRAMRAYKEVGYDGMMMPDHVPSIEGDTGGLQAFAFTFGYIKALIAAVSVES